MSGEDAGPRIVLASASPRRADILSQLGVAFEVRPAGVDESTKDGEEPGRYVERLARAKASFVAGCESTSAGETGAKGRPLLVIGGDTAVVHCGRILGKPTSSEEAVDMLSALAGGSHEVLTAVAVFEADGDRLLAASTTVSSVVRFRAFDRRFAREYVATREPMDKAGAYGVQKLGAAVVERIEGDFYSVMGLPVAALLSLLERLGWRYDFTALVRAQARRSER